MAPRRQEEIALGSKHIENQCASLGMEARRFACRERACATVIVLSDLASGQELAELEPTHVLPFIQGYRLALKRLQPAVDLYQKLSN